LTIPQLLARVLRHGFVVFCDHGQTALKKTTATAELPAELMTALKARKPELIEWFNRRAGDGQTCPKCHALVLLDNGVTREDVARCCRADGGSTDCPVS